jgi:hypothetical protein
MSTPTNHRRAWLIKAPLGLVLLSFGLCLVVEAGLYKAGGAANLDWVVYGTVALTVFNSGLCLLVDAGRHRGLMG